MGYVFDLRGVLSGQYLDWFLIGVATTLALTCAAWCLAMAMGIVLTLIRMIPLPPLGWLVALYVEYHRNVPLLVQIFVWYFGVPSLLPRPARQWINAHHGEFLLAAIALGLASAAYIAEDIRSGIRSIPKAQYEAARSIGFGYLGAMGYVVLPQAMRIAVAGFMSDAPPPPSTRRDRHRSVRGTRVPGATGPRGGPSGGGVDTGRRRPAARHARSRAPLRTGAAPAPGAVRRCAGATDPRSPQP